MASTTQPADKEYVLQNMWLLRYLITTILHLTLIFLTRLPVNVAGSRLIFLGPSLLHNPVGSLYLH